MQCATKRRRRCSQCENSQWKTWRSLSCVGNTDPEKFWVTRYLVIDRNRAWSRIQIPKRLLRSNSILITGGGLESLSTFDLESVCQNESLKSRLSLRKYHIAYLPIRMHRCDQTS